MQTNSLLPSVGAGRDAGGAIALRPLIRIAPAQGCVYCVWIGFAARREGQVPAPPLVVPDKRRQCAALLSGKADDLTAAMSECRTFLGDLRLGFGLRRRFPDRGVGTVRGKADGAPQIVRRGVWLNRGRQAGADAWRRQGVRLRLRHWWPVGLMRAHWRLRDVKAGH